MGGDSTSLTSSRDDDDAPPSATDARLLHQCNATRSVARAAEDRRDSFTSTRMSVRQITSLRSPKRLPLRQDATLALARCRAAPVLALCRSRKRTASFVASPCTSPTRPWPTARSFTRRVSDAKSATKCSRSATSLRSGGHAVLQAALSAALQGQRWQLYRRLWSRGRQEELGATRRARQVWRHGNDAQTARFVRSRRAVALVPTTAMALLLVLKQGGTRQGEARSARVKAQADERERAQARARPKQRAQCAVPKNDARMQARERAKAQAQARSTRQGRGGDAAASFAFDAAAESQASSAAEQRAQAAGGAGARARRSSDSPKRAACWQTPKLPRRRQSDACCARTR
jgi:hypothetical protein